MTVSGDFVRRSARHVSLVSLALARLTAFPKAAVGLGVDRALRGAAVNHAVNGPGTAVATVGPADNPENGARTDETPVGERTSGR